MTGMTNYRKIEATEDKLREQGHLPTNEDNISIIDIEGIEIDTKEFWNTLTLSSGTFKLYGTGDTIKDNGDVTLYGMGELHQKAQDDITKAFLDSKRENNDCDDDWEAI